MRDNTLLLCWVRTQIYRLEISQFVSARPAGKGRPKAVQTVRK